MSKRGGKSFAVSRKDNPPLDAQKLTAWIAQQMAAEDVKSTPKSAPKKVNEPVQSKPGAATQKENAAPRREKSRESQGNNQKTSRESRGITRDNGAEPEYHQRRREPSRSKSVPRSSGGSPRNSKVDKPHVLAERMVKVVIGKASRVPDEIPTFIDETGKPSETHYGAKQLRLNLQVEAAFEKKGGILGRQVVVNEIFDAFIVSILKGNRKCQDELREECIRKGGLPNSAKDVSVPATSRLAIDQGINMPREETSLCIADALCLSNAIFRPGAQAIVYSVFRSALRHLPNTNGSFESLFEKCTNLESMTRIHDDVAIVANPEEVKDAEFHFTINGWKDVSPDKVPYYLRFQQFCALQKNHVNEFSLPLKSVPPPHDMPGCFMDIDANELSMMPWNKGEPTGEWGRDVPNFTPTSSIKDRSGNEEAKLKFLTDTVQQRRIMKTHLNTRLSAPSLTTPFCILLAFIMMCIEEGGTTCIDTLYTFAGPDDFCLLDGCSMMNKDYVDFDHASFSLEKFGRFEYTESTGAVRMPNGELRYLPITPDKFNGLRCFHATTMSINLRWREAGLLKTATIEHLRQDPDYVYEPFELDSGNFVHVHFPFYASQMLYLGAASIVSSALMDVYSGDGLAHDCLKFDSSMYEGRGPFTLMGFISETDDGVRRNNGMYVARDMGTITFEPKEVSYMHDNITSVIRHMGFTTFGVCMYFEGVRPVTHFSFPGFGAAGHFNLPGHLSYFVEEKANILGTFKYDTTSAFDEYTAPHVYNCTGGNEITFRNGKVHLHAQGQVGFRTAYDVDAERERLMQGCDDVIATYPTVSHPHIDYGGIQGTVIVNTFDGYYKELLLVGLGNATVRHVEQMGTSTSWQMVKYNAGTSHATLHAILAGTLSETYTVIQGGSTNYGDIQNTAMVVMARPGYAMVDVRVIKPLCSDCPYESSFFSFVRCACITADNTRAAVQIMYKHAGTGQRHTVQEYIDLKYVGTEVDAIVDRKELTIVHHTIQQRMLTLQGNQIGMWITPEVVGMSSLFRLSVQFVTNSLMENIDVETLEMCATDGTCFPVNIQDQTHDHEHVIVDFDALAAPDGKEWNALLGVFSDQSKAISDAQNITIVAGANCGDTILCGGVVTPTQQCGEFEYNVCLYRAEPLTWHTACATCATANSSNCDYCPGVRETAVLHPKCDEFQLLNGYLHTPTGVVFGDMMDRNASEHVVVHVPQCVPKHDDGTSALKPPFMSYDFAAGLIDYRGYAIDKIIYKLTCDVGLIRTASETLPVAVGEITFHVPAILDGYCDGELVVTTGLSRDSQTYTSHSFRMREVPYADSSFGHLIDGDVHAAWSHAHNKYEKITLVAMIVFIVVSILTVLRLAYKCMVCIFPCICARAVNEATTPLFKSSSSTIVFGLLFLGLAFCDENVPEMQIVDEIVSLEKLESRDFVFNFGEDRKARVRVTLLDTGYRVRYGNSYRTTMGEPQLAGKSTQCTNHMPCRHFDGRKLITVSDEWQQEYVKPCMNGQLPPHTGHCAWMTHGLANPVRNRPCIVAADQNGGTCYPSIIAETPCSFDQHCLQPIPDEQEYIVHEILDVQPYVKVRVDGDIPQPVEFEDSEHFGDFRVSFLSTARELQVTRTHVAHLAHHNASDGFYVNARFLSGSSSSCETFGQMQWEFNDPHRKGTMDVSSECHLEWLNTFSVDAATRRAINFGARDLAHSTPDEAYLDGDYLRLRDHAAHVHASVAQKAWQQVEYSDYPTRVTMSLQSVGATQVLSYVKTGSLVTVVDRQCYSGVVNITAQPNYMVAHLQSDGRNPVDWTLKIAGEIKSTGHTILAHEVLTLNVPWVGQTADEDAELTVTGAEQHAIIKCSVHSAVVIQGEQSSFDPYSVVTNKVATTSRRHRLKFDFNLGRWLSGTYGTLLSLVAWTFIGVVCFVSVGAICMVPTIKHARQHVSDVHLYKAAQKFYASRFTAATAVGEEADDEAEVDDGFWLTLGEVNSQKFTMTYPRGPLATVTPTTLVTSADLLQVGYAMEGGMEELSAWDYSSENTPKSQAYLTTSFPALADEEGQPIKYLINVGTPNYVGYPTIEAALKDLVSQGHTALVGDERVKFEDDKIYLTQNGGFRTYVVAIARP